MGASRCVRLTGLYREGDVVARRQGEAGAILAA